MPSPIIIITAIVLIIIFRMIFRSRSRKRVHREILRRDNPIISTDETRLTENKTTFHDHLSTTQKSGATTVCKTCKGSKIIKCKLCHGFGSFKTARQTPPTTMQVPRMRTVFDAKGRPTHQHYYETQYKPGKVEYINQPCARCMGKGKIKCPDC